MLSRQHAARLARMVGTSIRQVCIGMYLYLVALPLSPAASQAQLSLSQVQSAIDECDMCKSLWIVA